MSSGNREIVVNPLERALSTDIMRGQNFIGAALSETLRALFDTSGSTDDVLAGGAYLQNLTQGNPLAAEILGGLLFVPAIASVASVVGPGVVCVFDPDTSPSTDDSQYKVVQDPGTSLLTLTANSSGSTRIDVVECSRVQPDNIVETDSRDIFNTVTGLFVAATVNKVSQAQLQYRIRTGTPAGGFPGTAQGWLPIAVASVPTGTTTWDTVTLWDVRPLVHDRTFGTSPVTQDLPRRTKLLYSANLGTGTQYLVNGIVEATEGLVGRRVGGRLLRGSPGTDFGQAYVDFSDTANQEAGMSLTGGSAALVYLYLITPFGLPRWSRYTDAAAGARVPRSPRGIPLLSKTAPSHVYGVSTAAIQFPAVFGFNGASSFGLCVGAFTYTGGFLNPSTTSDGWTNVSQPVPNAALTLPSTTIAVGSNGAVLPQATINVASTAGFPSSGFFSVDQNQVFYTGTTATTFTGCSGGSASLTTGDKVLSASGTIQLTENVHFPAGATRLRFKFSMQIESNGAAGSILTLLPVVNFAEVGNSAKQFTNLNFESKDINVYNGGTEFFTITWYTEAELTNHYPNLATGNPWEFIFSFGGGIPSNVTYLSPQVTVVGWKFE